VAISDNDNNERALPRERRKTLKSGRPPLKFPAVLAMRLNAPAARKSREPSKDGKGAAKEAKKESFAGFSFLVSFLLSSPLLHFPRETR